MILERVVRKRSRRRRSQPAAARPRNHARCARDPITSSGTGSRYAGWAPPRRQHRVPVRPLVCALAVNVEATMATHEGKVALITGASAGIGAALARELARDGAGLVPAPRREDRLRELAHEIEAMGRHAIVVGCDVTCDGDLERAVAAAVERYGRLDIAIANAGFGVAGLVAELRLDDFRRQLETNVFG